MKRPKDPKAAAMVNLLGQILDSVPTILEPGPHGPLSEDEILAAADHMDELGRQIKAEREKPPQT